MIDLRGKIVSLETEQQRLRFREMAKERLKDFATKRIYLRASYADADRKAREHQNTNEIEILSFEGEKRQAFKQLQESVSTCNIPMMIPPSYLMLPATDLPLKWRFLISPSANSLEAGQSFGSGLGGKFSISDDWFKDQQQIKLCLDTPLANACMVRSNQWTPLGIETTDTPRISPGTAVPKKR